MLRLIVIGAVLVLVVILLAPPTSAFGRWIAGAFDRLARRRGDRRSLDDPEPPVGRPPRPRR